MTTLAVPRSRRTSATAVYHALVSNVLYGCHIGGKIQGYFSLEPQLSLGHEYGLSTPRRQAEAEFTVHRPQRKQSSLDFPGFCGHVKPGSTLPQTPPD